MTGGNEGEHEMGGNAGFGAGNVGGQWQPHGGDSAAENLGGAHYDAPEFAGRVQAAAGHAGDYVPEPFDHHADHVASGDELNLTDHERLPWLGGDDEDEEPAIDHKRLGAFVAGALALLAALVGGIWWISHPHGTMAEANGGTIAAPATPYKEAPKDPGGKTFAGTGDSSFAVSQGQARPGQLAETGAKAAAGAAAGAAGVAKAGDNAGANAAHAAAAVAAKATGADDAAEPAPSGGLAQVGAYSNRAAAEAGWSRLSQQSSALSGAHHRIVEGQADIGTVYRLQVVTGAGGAASLCEKLRAGGLACQVKH